MMEPRLRTVVGDQPGATPGEPLVEEFSDRRVRAHRRGDVGVRRQHFELALRIGPSAAHGPHDPPAFSGVRVGSDITRSSKELLPR